MENTKKEKISGNKINTTKEDKQNKNQLESLLQKHKPIHIFFLNSIFQGNLVYVIYDLQSSRNFKPIGFLLVFATGYLSMNFLVNDVLIPKIFSYDPLEVQLPLLKEFLIFQRRFFKVDWIKRIFSSGNELNFINESSSYSKELLMDVKINSFDKYKF